ncbi:MAG: DNA polymerase III subunit gamma/tau [Planctomycetota bacterium]
MSYTVLARRYRSRTFDEVVGQEHVALTLKKAIETGRVAHAYLFCGTRGVGKTSMARIMAAALQAPDTDERQGPSSEFEPDQEWAYRIFKGEDLDVIEIDAASNTGVDNVREIIENAQYRPAHSRFKVYIIDEVHMLSKAAFNALLKTMEEPPGHVKFILATTEPERVPATILSRVQRYDFRNIPTAEIAGHLRDVVESEKREADDEALMLVAKAGAGSMRDALSLLDRLLSVGDKLTAEHIVQMLGMPRQQALADLTDAIGNGAIGQVLEQTEAMLAAGLSGESLVTALSDHLRDLLLMATCGKDTDLVEPAGLERSTLATQADKFTPADLAQDIAILEDLKRNLRGGTGRALLDATLVRLTLASQFTPVNELLDGAKKKLTA